MAFYGKYGELSAKDASIASLRDIEAALIPEEREYIASGKDKEGFNYDNLRCYYTIMGLQRVVLLNGGSLAFSLLPNISVSHEKRYLNKHGAC